MFLKSLIICSLLLFQTSFALSHFYNDLLNPFTEPVSIKDYPYLVSIHSNETLLCGGTIISLNVVATAAHCFRNITPDEISQIYIRLNSNYSNIGGQIAFARKIVEHSSVPYESDVAVVILQKNLRGSGFKILQLSPEGSSYKSGTPGYVLTWDQNSSEIAKKSIVYIWGRKKCREGGEYFPTQFCASGGTSGDPLIVKNPVSGDELAGISSFPASTYTQVSHPQIFRFFRNQIKNHLITHGVPVTNQDYLFVVSLHRTSNDEYACAGTIISPNVIATAAHCFNNTRRQNLRDGSWLYARIGSKYKYSGGTLVDVKEIVKHPSFGLRVPYRCDAAVVILDSRLRGPGGYKILPLAPAGTKFRAGTEGFIFGWGLTERDTYPDVLLETNVFIWNQDKCRILTEDEYHPAQLCASNGIHDSCVGDSGGPLMVKNELAGIISFTAVEDDVTPGCGLKSGAWSVYTYVSHPDIFYFFRDQIELNP